MKHKIGIITILKVNNYGAELQAYATAKILQLIGNEAEIIDYLFYKNPLHKRTKMSKPTAKMSLRKHIAERLLPILARWKSRKFKAKYNERVAKFEQFHKENTKQSVCYNSIEKLKSASLDYDILLTGSDQVWNPGIYSSLDPYFLRFGNDNMRRIAYAASFGVSDIPDDVKSYYNESLRRYFAIGVREGAAVDMVKRLSGRDAKLVLDPTLLLDRGQWMQVAKPVDGLPDKPYILIYELSATPYLKQLAQYISLQTGMPIVRICKNACPEDKGTEIINVIDAGPAEFLYMFDNAEFIVTNSFHGTAFAINFGKQFYTILRKGKNNNSRQKSILKLLNCEERMLEEGSCMPKITRLNTQSITSALNKERQESINFLKSAIDGAPQ